MTIKLLHLDSSILGENSASRILSAAAVRRLNSLVPDLTVIYRDLAAVPIPHLSRPYWAAMHGAEGPHDPSLKAELTLGAQLMDEFLWADVLVLGVAFYNYSVASQLKAWVDRILVAGKTFRYSPRGVEGLVGGKRVILTVARGGTYGAGTPTEHSEHGATYMQSVFQLCGIDEIEVIVAEGLAFGPEARDRSLSVALAQISELSAMSGSQFSIRLSDAEYAA